MKQALSFAATSCSLLLLGGPTIDSFVLLQHSNSRIQSKSSYTSVLMTQPEGPAGSFFHRVPDDTDDIQQMAGGHDGVGKEESDSGSAAEATSTDLDDALSKLIKQRRRKPLASHPSTINGVPIEKVAGFGKPKAGKGKKQKPHYVAIGSTTSSIPINDPSRPEIDDQGYTLYTDEETGEKSRVFEALVDYPCVFTMKIVGVNEGTFVQDILDVVADATESNVSDISHSTKALGKWTSVTVKAPVQSSEMLYTLYEKVDLDPRVKFKF
jgi:putative lipoic acid-binding regulatory protein